MPDHPPTQPKKNPVKEALNAAIWVTCSPHEWEWTHEQQVAMARYCVEAAKVISIARNQLEMIVCTEGCDAGVVLLSQDGPTHYDAEAKCQVYDHEYFSPLGDALIALHKKLSSLCEDKSDA